MIQDIRTRRGHAKNPTQRRQAVGALSVHTQKVVMKRKCSFASRVQFGKKARTKSQSWGIALDHAVIVGTSWNGIPDFIYKPGSCKKVYL